MSQTADKYKKEAIPALLEKFSYPNVMAVPKIDKVVINTGIGRVVGQKTGEDLRNFLAEVTGNISEIAGQHAVLTEAKQSIAGFKLREGSTNGAKVTLRGPRMNDFLDRLITIVFPRSRDFRGLKTGSVDATGNLTLGLPELIFFPEILPEKIRNPFGIAIIVHTTAKTHKEGLALLRLVGFPFQKDQ